MTAAEPDPNVYTMVVVDPDQFEARGEVEIKGKGKGRLRTHLLVGPRPSEPA